MARLAIRMLGYIAIIAVVLLVIFIQAGGVHGDDLYSEGSLTEWMQILVLTCALFVMVRIGNLHAEHKRLTSLLSGVLTIAIVRESDNAFDRYLFDGAWQVTAAFVLVVTFLMAIREKSSLSKAIREFASTSGYGLMIAGALTVGLFSRVYGKKSLWMAVMGDKFMYSVKAASEENIELLGYCFILISAMEWIFWCVDRTSKTKEA